MPQTLVLGNDLWEKIQHARLGQATFSWFAQKNDYIENVIVKYDSCNNVTAKYDYAFAINVPSCSL